MKTSTELNVACSDFLKDNRHVYARKARRKKIALIKVEAANNQREDVQLRLQEFRLIAGAQDHKVESPAVILGKFSEFTWDFIVYAILDFQPWLIAVDAFFFLSGPIYNRRLKMQLKLLSDGTTLLKAGESKEIVLGFGGVRKEPTELVLRYASSDGHVHETRCRLKNA